MTSEKIVDIPQEIELNRRARNDLASFKDKEAEDFAKLDSRVANLEQDVAWIKENMVVKPKPV